MTFKEMYKMELETIKRDTVLDKAFFQRIDEDSKPISPMRQKFASIVVVTIFVFMVCNFETVAIYATSLIANFSLALGGEVIILDEIESIEFDYERYLTDERADKKGANYYSSYEDFCEGLGMTLPGSEILEYTQVSVFVNLEYNVGHIGTQFFYEDELYEMNGRFVISDYAYENLGYGEKDKAYLVYEYTDGKKAYFVKKKGSDYQMVYFSTEKYVFQLKVENSKKGVEKAKRILDSMGEFI